LAATSESRFSLEEASPAVFKYDLPLPGSAFMPKFSSGCMERFVGTSDSWAFIGFNVELAVEAVVPLPEP
jgi:hypothetical protein